MRGHHDAALPDRQLSSDQVRHTAPGARRRSCARQLRCARPGWPTREPANPPGSPLRGCPAVPASNRAGQVGGGRGGPPLARPARGAPNWSSSKT